MKWRVPIAIALLLTANFLVVWGQSLVAFSKWWHLAPFLIPEGRYYLPSLVLLLPMIPMVLMRMRYGRKLLCLLLLALVAHAVGYLVKAQVPGARRHAYLAACDWAVKTIREDYAGPSRDAEPFFTLREYHRQERPVVDAHTARVPYLLGGRRASMSGCDAVDTPDYIVDEPHRVNRGWFGYAAYEILVERRFGNRDFIIYKRVK